jgi:hypothetical protein
MFCPIIAVMFSIPMFLPIIPGICEEEDASNGLIPATKIVIIILLATHSTEAVEGKDKRPFFVRNSSPYVHPI